MHDSDSPSATPMNHLVALSHLYGSDIEFVIAGGGNTSCKSDGFLYVKGSGTALASIAPDGFVEMDRSALSAILERDLGSEPREREARFKDSILAARLRPERGQRPSVECVLHNLLPGRYVVHTHSTWINMVGCMRAGASLARDLFGDEILWIPYVDPGYTLARTLAEALAALRPPAGSPLAVVMEGHGLIVSADTPGEIGRMTDRLVGRVRERIGRLSREGRGTPAAPPRFEAAAVSGLIRRLGPALRGALAEGERLKIVRFDDRPFLREFFSSPEGLAAAAAGPLTPDQIVYCQSFPLIFRPDPAEAPGETSARLSRAVEEHRSRTGTMPQVVAAEGLGIFAAGDDYGQAENARLSYADAVKIMAGAALLGGVRHMPARDREFIEDWEVEAYRRKVAAGARREGLASGKVAVVTGAAQGFGLEIAEDLLAEGAAVVLCDINEAGVRAQAERLSGRWGDGRAAALGVDVADGDSLAQGFDRVVRAYGGLDLLVSNAGVLRAGSVLTQAAEEFDLVTRVNYTGYFLAVRAAAPIMAMQHRTRPDSWSDIVQINSKSGLVGSNRNGAYAGSKFGGIGLTQSFALELVEDGIKVNAVCPGNYFDGPLWSDPETGLFVQYLRTGKVPGARTVADVRRFYEAKIPMGRGCTTADVMKAVYYFMSQKYETGQALPVTGGQIMLH